MAPCDTSAHQAPPATFLIPPLKKGGQGGFSRRHAGKSPTIPLFQRAELSFQTISERLTASLTFAIALLITLVAASFAHAQRLPAAEKQKIEALIKQVGELNDANFIRNGSVYEPAIAVRFLRGKWNAKDAEVKTVRDFIDKVASRSGSSGKPYLIRFNDGKEIPSRDFLMAELEKLES